MTNGCVALTVSETGLMALGVRAARLPAKAAAETEPVGEGISGTV